MSAITIMNEDEVQRAESVAPEAGFGCISTASGNLPVKALDVKTRIAGLVYEVTVRQTYVNRYTTPLEATYIFPLPDRGAVGDFKMFVGGREIEGVLKERGEARRDYDEAIAAGHRASIVEEERPDTFTMRVGNVEPGEDVTIEFKVTGPLIFADGEATFRFPLVVAPRYIPGTPLEGGNVGDGTASDTDAVPDASRITPPVLLPGFPSPIALSIACEIERSDLEITNVRSSLHAVTVSQSDGTHRIAIQPGERVNRDFILRFDVGDADVQSAATFTRDADGARGTFMVTLVPPVEASGAELPRDLVFVLDRSGSMGGWKMVAARRALGRMLDTLTPKDRFQIIIFDNESTKFESGLLDATNRNRYRAIEYLSKVEARGGTEMARPIFEGLEMLVGGYQDRRRMLVLVTDGQVGNEQQIVAGVQQRQKNVSIFTVGIDQAVNAGFLNRLADIGGGRCELVESEDRLDEAMDRIHRTIDTPVLTELAVTLDGVKSDPDMLTPERVPALFVGAPLQLFGRFEGKGSPVVQLTAARRDGSRWETTLRARETGDAATTAIWARQKVRALEDRYAKTPSPELSSQVTKLSLRFGVLCRFTSWVAVDQEQKIESAGNLRQVMQPVEQPAGWQGQVAPAAPKRFGGPPPIQAMAPMAPMGMMSGAPGAARGGGFSGAYDQPDAEMRQQAPKMRSHERSKKREREEGTMTQAGQVVNNSALSPEQARGEQIDERTDVFLLGLAGFTLLTGRRLFHRSNQFDTLQAIVAWDPAQLANEPGVTGHWLDVLTRALRPDPAARYASPRELLTDLESKFGPITTSSMAWPHADDRTLQSLVGTVDMAQALWVFAWLIAAVGQVQDLTGQPMGVIPADAVVEGGSGKVHFGDVAVPGFFEKLKRWLGGTSEPRRDDDFWK